MTGPHDNDAVGELARRHGVFIGLIALGLLLAIGGVASSDQGLVLLGVAAVIGGVVMAAQKARGATTPIPGQAATVSLFPTVPVPERVRQDRLQEYLAQDLARSQGRVESFMPYSAVVVYGKPVNHVLHLLITALLCGLWLPVWLIIALSGGEKRAVLSVDECGNITRR